ncbi:hypothetical protein G6F55_002206 [Rhizopus delemar]|uniref:Uncharacterized protein n=1 Tax=Rhizopus delemar TaxID=936053 RepID=A0A9P6Z7D5_9FUNG|nr:hypothetical protein G6F55_002206 [Rhizopus delemar]KAG1522391.1 hypothetical protein G6F52_005899 [Rhizopus delemar]KAG1571901.1 hypothetical protein G6F50_004207 [Rhizopus delemar]KAG1588782.1 hypothetical protein G6F48_005047 [Rhizopus delemar]KAG1628946.1 hypothetical protein G6F45_006565 [Rhizopus arrhizus]
MGAAHTVAAIDKGTERLRTTARSTTEIDSDLKCIMEEGRTRRPRPNPEENETSCDLRGVCATRKELDQVAKERTTHVLCLPRDRHEQNRRSFFLGGRRGHERRQRPTKPADRTMTTASKTKMVRVLRRPWTSIRD